VIDPHKHGLQPYGCGCVLFRDPEVGRLFKHDSPYTYFSSAELHLGEISLECSRPGAAAAALWATQRLLPLKKGGEFARGLERGRKAALALFKILSRDARFVTPFSPELDIVVFAPKAASASESSVLSRKIFEAAAKRDLHSGGSGIADSFLGGASGSNEARSRNHHLPALRTHEARAFRLGRAHLGAALCVCGREPRHTPLKTTTI